MLFRSLSPLNLISSFIFTFVPNSDITSPLTVTKPAVMYWSASLLEQTPEFAMNLFRRIEFGSLGCFATGFSPFFLASPSTNVLFGRSEKLLRGLSEKLLSELFLSP